MRIERIKENREYGFRLERKCDFYFVFRRYQAVRKLEKNYGRL